MSEQIDLDWNAAPAAPVQKPAAIAADVVSAAADRGGDGSHVGGVNDASSGHGAGAGHGGDGSRSDGAGNRNGGAGDGSAGGDGGDGNGNGDGNRGGGTGGLLGGGSDDGSGDDGVILAHYAQHAYLEYALSVVKGRALPDVADGQKPVQRRILYAMHRMGLGWGGARGNTPSKPVKSARVVGDVLGRFHPHGDQAAYDAMVRMAQDFSQRYPLIDGHGNFGSRDGDGAAAMRYTEARLAKITHLLLDEIDEGTVDFIPNYDGSTQEPQQLPARLPFALLNGASGIAVGMATDIPSHNLGEVAQAAIALIENRALSDAELMALLPGPDFPGGGQIISTTDEITKAYETGRGSLRVRARWKIEHLARGQWQLVVTELPPGASAHSVLAQIEDITNPKNKPGKKALTQEQTQLKASVLAVLDRVRDESSKDAPVRIVFEPKSRTVGEEEFISTLLAHTGLEGTVPVNLTGVGLDGKPVQKSLRQMLTEWVIFREQTVARRSRHRLDKVLERIHILEGRQLVLLNIDEVIHIIRNSDDPRAALIARFGLSERQAEDILDIRLRQLARLEAIRIEQELAELRKEQSRLEDILAHPKVLQRLLIKEIRADAEEYGDARRTILKADEKTTTEVRIVDEPVTVVVSEQGWVRVRQGHGHDPAIFGFKAGDALYDTFECRSVDTLLVLGSNGRVYSVAAAQLPGGRGDGQPVTTLIDLEPGTRAQHFVAGPLTASVLLASSDGYGFLAEMSDMVTRMRAGKTFVALADGAALCRPALVPADVVLKEEDAAADGALNDPSASTAAAPGSAQPQLVCISEKARALAFDAGELRVMRKGGRGLKLMSLGDKDMLVGAALSAGDVAVSGSPAEDGSTPVRTLDARALARVHAARARSGKRITLGFKPVRVAAVLAPSATPEEAA